MKKLIFASTALLVVLLFGFAFKENESCPHCSFGNLANAEGKTAGEITPSESNIGIISINENNFESEVLNSSAPVVVEFYAEWCGSCKKLAPNFEAFSKEHEGMLKFGKIDVDQNPNLAKQYSVDAIPRIVVFESGKIVKDHVGYQSLDDLEKNYCGMCKSHQ